METVQLLNELALKLEEVKAQILANEAAFEAAKEAYGKDKYNEGFAAGVASMGQGEKIYTHDEAQTLIAEAVAPLKKQVEELEAKVVELQAIVDGVPAQVKQAVDEFKAWALARVKDEADDFEAIFA